MVNKTPTESEKRMEEKCDKIKTWRNDRNYEYPETLEGEKCKEFEDRFLPKKEK